jgi:hypothetical protein
VSMRGGEIFPNEPVHERGQPVDLSLSRTVGSPAGENRDIALAVERFDGSYTRALVTGLSGQEVRIVEPSPTQKGFGFIYPRSLSRYLEEIWPRQARMGKAAIEGPETRISSGEDAWLAYVPLTQPSSGSRK